MKRVASWGFVLGLALQPALAAVADEAGAAEKAREDFQRVENSVQALLDALERTASEKSSNGEINRVASQARERIRQGHRLLKAGDAEAGRAELDKALVSVKSAIAAMREGETLGKLNGDQQDVDSGSERKALADYQRQRDSLDALIGALGSISQEKAADDAARVAQQARQMRSQSQQLADSGHVGEAQALVGRAQLLVKTSIAGLRGGETLVRSLDFATKKDEYYYERDRFETYQMLLELLVAKRVEGKPALQQQVAAQRELALKQRAQAEQSAASGEYERAVEELEAASRELLKAIRRGGVFVPG